MTLPILPTGLPPRGRARRLPFVLPALVVLSGLAAGPVRADATIPTGDIPGARDTAVLQRYDGSFIVSYGHFAYTDFRMPLSPLQATDRTDGMNNTLFLPRQQKELEGELTRLVYVLPADRSPLEAVRSYQDEIEAKGGEALFACKGEECGGNPHRAAHGGGGDSSLTQYFLSEDDIQDELFSNGECVLTDPISDQRFLAARLPLKSGDAYVTVQAYVTRDDASCAALTGRTVALVHVLLPADREHRMAPAGDMAAAIGAEGRVALAGLLFDGDSAELRPESDPALDQVARMMQADPGLAVLVVGHTDNAGAFDHNLDLSRRRADAVVRALTTHHGIAAGRLRAIGIGMAAPAASNAAAEGRIRNRRVELVKLN